MGRTDLDWVALTDVRFRILGKAIGVTSDDALGKCVRIWQQCTIRRKHNLSAEQIDTIVGFEGFCAGMVKADLARPHGKAFYVKGTRGRIEWYGNRVKGGQSRGKVGTRNKNGKFTSSRKPAADQPLPYSTLPSTTLIKEESSTAPPAAAPAAARPDLPPWDQPADHDVRMVEPPKRYQLPKNFPNSPDIGEMWNKNCGALPKVLGLSGMRKKLWHSRWRKNPDEGYWVQAIQRVATSKFCRGETGNWKATLDWFLKEGNHLKVIEGQYDDRGAVKAKPKYTFEESS